MRSTPVSAPLSATPRDRNLPMTHASSAGQEVGGPSIGCPWGRSRTGARDPRSDACRPPLLQQRYSAIIPPNKKSPRLPSAMDRSRGPFARRPVAPRRSTSFYPRTGNPFPCDGPEGVVTKRPDACDYPWGWVVYRAPGGLQRSLLPPCDPSFLTSERLPSTLWARMILNR